ncbi:MAG: hypothetical protein AAF602_19325 [Myxococcota bacterium]
MLVLLFVACTSDAPGPFPAVTLWNAFPFESGRTWTYTFSDDPSRELVATLAEGGPSGDDPRVYTVVYEERCAPPCPDPVGLQWSSGPDRGIAIHGSAVGAASVDYDPPVRLAAPSAEAGTSWATVAGTGVYLTTFLGLESCPTGSPSFDACARLLVDHTGPDLRSLPIEDLYAAPAHGIVALRFVGELGLWRLSDVDCGTCDGEW